MAFKKLTTEEIKYSDYENLIGMSFNKNEGKLLSEHDKTSEISGKEFSKKEKNAVISFSRMKILRFDLNNKILDLKEEDFLSIQNTSESDKIWNVKLQLEEISQEFIINELNANEKWERSLGKQDDETENHLEIFEKVSKVKYIDNIKEDSQYFIEADKENIFYFSIFLKNKSNNVLFDIKFNKKIPKTIIKVIEAQSMKGTTNHSLKLISWNIERLNPGEIANLQFKIVLRPKPVNSGVIHVEFGIELDKTQLHKVKNWKASAKIAQFVDINEQDENPGKWDCSLRFLNRSDYSLKINQIKLFESKLNEKEEIFSSTSGEVIKPYEEKILFQKTISSKVSPVLSTTVNYAPQFIILEENNCQIAVNDTRMEILNIIAQKEFLSEAIKSFKISEFDARISLQNLSSIPINHLIFEEFLPSDFSVKDFSKIKIEIDNHTLDLGKIKSKIYTPSGEEDIDLLTNKIIELEESILNMKKEGSDLINKSRFIKSKITQTSTAEQSNQQEKILNSLEDVQIKIKDFKGEIKTLQGSIREKEETLEEQSTILSLLQDHKKIAEEIEELSKKLIKNEKVLSTNQKKMKKLRKGLENVNKDIKSNTLSEKVAILIKNKETLEKKINDNEDDYQQQMEKVDDLKKNINEKEQSIENATLKQIKSKIENTENQKLKIIGEISDEGVQKENLEEKLENFKLLLENSQSDFRKLEDEKETFQKTLNELSFAKDQYSKLKNAYIEANDDYIRLKNQKAEILEKENQTFSKAQIFDQIYKEFKENSLKNNENIYINTFTLDTGNLMILYITNLKKIFKNVVQEKTLSLTYPITASRPRNDKEYLFETSIYYASDPVKNIQKYEIPQHLIPKLDIYHERKKLTLGKIVDSYTETGKFQVTLLIRNQGSNLIEKLQIINNMPISSEISNSFYKFTENKLNDEIKEVIWKLDKIRPYEEMEISYLVDLGQENYDLNDYEMKII